MKSASAGGKGFAAQLQAMDSEVPKKYGETAVGVSGGRGTQPLAA